MKWYFSIGLWLGIAAFMYLFFAWVKREAEKINKKNKK